MVNHHPSEDMIFDYATGALGEGLSLVVATHLTYCPGCRSTLRACEQVGGALIAVGAPAVTAAHPALEQAVRSEVRRTGGTSSYPAPLAAYASQLRWRTTFPGLKEAELALAEDGVRASLMQIAPGRAMPRHSHAGVEATLVLQGGFSDQDGHYLRGDVALADDAIDHRPRADAGEPCVCLAVTAAPLRLTGVFGRVLDLIRR